MVASKESDAEADARIKAAIDKAYAEAGEGADIEATNAKVLAIPGWDAFNNRVEASAIWEKAAKPFGGVELPPFPSDAPEKVEARPIREGAPPPPPRRKKAGRAIVSDVPEYVAGAAPHIEPGEDVDEDEAVSPASARLKERLGGIPKAPGIERIMPRAKKPREGHLTIISTISRPAGSGKSYQMMKWMEQQGDDQHHIIASPSLALISEHEAALIEAGVAPERIKVITSHTGKKTVRVQLREFFRKMPPTEPMILLCTHAAMIMERPDETELIETKKGSGEWVESFVWAPEDWRLWWDEAPDVLVFGQQHCPYQHRIWTPFVRATRLGNGLMQLGAAKSLPDSFDTERWEPVDFLKRIARNHPLEDAFTAIQTLCGAIANENKLVLVREDAWLDLTAPGARRKVMEGVLDTMIITHPANYGDFNEVVMLGARLANTMAMILWQQMFGIKMEEHPIAKLIPPTHETKRLAVHYVFEERASRTFLEKKNERGDTMFAEMAVAIAKELVKHDEQALWNAPVAGDDRRYGVKNDFFAPLGKKYGVKPRAGKGMPFSKDHRLPGRTQGLNAYLDRHHVALLSVLRFSPEQSEMLEMIGLTEEQIDRAFQFNSNYQDAMRLNLRLEDGAVIKMGQKDVRGEGINHIYLPDRASAEDFVKDFPALKGVIKQVAEPSVNGPKPRDAHRDSEEYKGLSEAEKSKRRSKERRDRMRAQRAQAREASEKMASAGLE